MKKNLAVISVFVAICISVSCKKEKVQSTIEKAQPPVETTQPPVPSTRTIKFILYTNKDFSTDDDTISFLLKISNNIGTSQSRTVFDSTLATIRLKDIPGPSNKLVFSKTLPNDGTVLSAGFVYTTRFGYSWFLDTCGVNQKSKVIEYPFQ